MTILTEQALEFAKAHISKYYDSDFFPKPPEFDAIWHSWDDVKKELSSKNISKFWVIPPRALAAPKTTGDFRVVHQLEPLDAIIYTALAFEIADAIEEARPPANEKVACSYRFNLEDGNFFSGGTGYGDFIEAVETLSDKFEYILVTDITDFYNQIYLHRLNHAIEYADKDLKSVGDDLEGFISRLNSKASQGIPVGPAASIVMSESVLIDVDLYIKNQGFHHTRYVDDFRIFGDSFEQLRQLQQSLTLYLYENHRLVLSGYKTEIKNADDYVKQKLHNPYAEEKTDLFKSLEIFNPYTEDVEEIEIEIEDENELLIARLTHIINRVLEFKKLDIGLARSAIRRARRHAVVEVLEPILDNLELFAPVINDVVLYLEEVIDDDTAQTLCLRFAELIDSPVLDLDLVRYWVEWHLSAHRNYLANDQIYNFIKKTPYFTNRARAAITLGDLAWVRDKKAVLHHLGSWERRALLNAARVLPGDEREHWLKLTEGSSPLLIDRWMAKWVRETSL